MDWRGAFVLITLLAILFGRETARPIWAHLSFVSLLELTICGLKLATGGRDPFRSRIRLALRVGCALGTRRR